MPRVLVMGAGKIGSLVASLLAQSKEYEVHVGDRYAGNSIQSADNHVISSIQRVQLDASKSEDLDAYLTSGSFDALISALPYYCNVGIAQLARKFNLHYFDLTEDVEVTRQVRKISKNATSAFVPQCGLAPGYISIVANSLMQDFDTYDTVKMRVGALPVNPNNALKYSLTWSTDGLINEYGNTCYAIENNESVELQPLEGYETISLDGLLYEAFNTSGGLGTLAETYSSKVKRMNYKTLRYPGHCKKIQFLMNELKLNEDRDTLKRVLEKAIPKTLQDVVLIYVSVSGLQKGELFEKNYVQKIYPQKIGNKLWSAIQITTAAGICSVVDLVFFSNNQKNGFIRQEEFSLESIHSNQFGKYYVPDTT